MNTSLECTSVETTPNDVGGTNNIETRKWYVALVNNNTEKSVQQRLTSQGYETYVAKQSVMRLWKNGKKTTVEKVVLPLTVFIKCTELERRQLVTLPYINRFMVNKAARTSNGSSRPLATIPDSQIDLLRFMLGQSDIPIVFEEVPIKVNDHVMIIRGHLKGVQGEVLQTKEGKSEVIVRVDLFGAAKMTIDTTELELIK